MSDIGDAMRNHHRELISTLRSQVDALVSERPEADPEALVTFLERELIPHAVGEERHLYAVVDRLIQEHGRPTATMSIDHREIGDRTLKIRQTVQSLFSIDEAERPAVEATLRRLADEIAAIFDLHMRKEEEVFLPLFERYLTEAEQRTILDGMHEVSDELDVRRIAPPERHRLIFETFESLGPGASFVLVNDHDPRPLYYQFAAERSGTFTWDYQEQGPRVWRVRIGKAA